MQFPKILNRVEIHSNIKIKGHTKCKDRLKLLQLTHAFHLHESKIISNYSKQSVLSILRI